ncbi:MAG TPA: DUF3467 domain-containing protein [Candidatus Saccharimonadales bacterium]|nr:DUF3467 domain-containing protein [Candidatus Saccharimonadales bacterium]
MKDLNKMGNMVRKERVKHNLSLSELGKKLAVDRTLISKIENGHYQPTEPILQKFIEVFSMDDQHAQKIWALSGRPGGPFTNLNSQGKELLMNQSAVPQKVPQQASVNLNPSTPVLYSDAMSVTTSPFGMVFDFGQRLGPTNNFNVVARVGVSFEHARKIMEAIHNELEKNEK